MFVSKNCIFWTNQSLNKSYGEGNRMISFHSITMHKGNREGKHTSKFCPLKSHWYTLRKRRHSLGQSIWLKSSILSDDRKLQIHNCYLNVRISVKIGRYRYSSSASCTFHGNNTYTYPRFQFEMTNETLQHRYTSWQDAFKVRVLIFFLTTLWTKINN